MGNPLLIKSYTAALGAVPPRRLVFLGPNGSVALGSAASDPVVGVSGELGAEETGQRVDVVEVGIADVEYGGDVFPGDLLASDAGGRAVVPVGAARVIGPAMVGGAAGDIGAVKVSPSFKAA